MTDPHRDEAIAASLRRQFSPPALDALAERIAAEAARREDDAPRAADVTPPTKRPFRGAFAIAFVLAAALVLLLLRPWSPAVPPAAPPRVAEGPPPEPEVPPPTVSERAGLQLHTFLTRGASLPVTVAASPEVCETDVGYPHLSEQASGVVEQLGECGGATDARCEAFELPADRALLVELASGERVILCIERPWADPEPELPTHSNLKAFRSELGDFVIYEITPLDRPRATDFLRL